MNAAARCNVNDKLQALYTTEVSSGIFSMTLATTPNIGPFNVGNKRDCYWNSDGISCDRTAFCGRCPAEFCKGPFDMFCSNMRRSGPMKNIGICAW